MLYKVLTEQLLYLNDSFFVLGRALQLELHEQRQQQHNILLVTTLQELHS